MEHKELQPYLANRSAEWLLLVAILIFTAVLVVSNAGFAELLRHQFHQLNEGSQLFLYTIVILLFLVSGYVIAEVLFLKKGFWSNNVLGHVVVCWLEPEEHPWMNKEEALKYRVVRRRELKAWLSGRPTDFFYILFPLGGCFNWPKGRLVYQVRQCADGSMSRTVTKKFRGFQPRQPKKEVDSLYLPETQLASCIIRPFNREPHLPVTIRFDRRDRLTLDLLGALWLFYLDSDELNLIRRSKFSPLMMVNAHIDETLQMLMFRNELRQLATQSNSQLSLLYDTWKEIQNTQAYGKSPALQMLRESLEEQLLKLLPRGDSRREAIEAMIGIRKGRVRKPKGKRIQPEKETA